MDPKLEEAAEASGASTARMIWSVTVPLIWRGSSRRELYFYRRTFRVRRAGDHRLVQPHFHFQHLYVPDGQPQEGLPRYGLSATFSIIGIVLAAVLGWWYAQVQKRSHQYEVITGKAYHRRS